MDSPVICPIPHGRLVEDRLAPQNPNLLIAVHHDLGRLAERAGDASLAIDHYRKAIRLVEQSRATFSGESARIGFVGDKEVIYRDLVRLLSEGGRVEEALEFTERAKARALVDLLASRERFGPQEGDEAPRLAEFIRADELLAQPSPARTESEFARRRGQRTTALAKLSAATRALVTVETLEAAGIRRALDEGEVLIEYYGDGDSSLLAFVVDRDNVELHRLDAEGLREDVAELRAVIAELEEWEEIAVALHERLLGPFAARIATAERLTIVPHGALHYLPFNVLHDGERTLIERTSLRLLPSASVLALLGEPQAGGSLLVLGNPDLGDPSMDLPGAEEEARVIAAMAGTDATLRLRASATESYIKRAARNHGALHLASHGEFRPEAPLASRLLLAPDREDDGYLTVPEIYDLELAAERVVLSACETGLGEVANGDDVIGLTRGFLYAGAASVVASLWPVSDAATQLLMTRYYEFGSDEDVAEALRRAQLATMERFPHPSDWAAFQLTGQP